MPMVGRPLGSRLGQVLVSNPGEELAGVIPARTAQSFRAIPVFCSVASLLGGLVVQGEHRLLSPVAGVNRR